MPVIRLVDKTTSKRFAIDRPPNLARSSLSAGIKPGSSPVDRTGGDYGGGIIRGVAALTRGEAQGHGQWVDGQMLQDAANAINSRPNGAKSRFTHPNLSSDGLGSFLGRAKNATVDGDTVRVDHHFAKSAHNAPDGDLAGYLMDRAEEDPASFGASIAFAPDQDAEQDFVAANGGKKFKSPDPLNKNNLPHARIKKMHAVDIVDSPAANPNGLFGRGQEIVRGADAMLDYALGLSSEKPEGTLFGVDPDRLSQFVGRFLKNHNLKITQLPRTNNGGAMPTETKPATPLANLQTEQAALTAMAAESAKLQVEIDRRQAEAREAEKLAELSNALGGSTGLVKYAASIKLPGKTTEPGVESFADEAARLTAELRAKETQSIKLQSEIDALQAKAQMSTAGKPSPTDLARARNCMGSDAMTRALASGRFAPPTVAKR